MAGKRRVISGNERRTLAAMHHVVGAHVIDDIDARFAGEQRAVANLNGQGIVGTVKHRLSMKANDINIF
ncbi:hypothetical protein D9M72_640950 [compost metagenome]